MDEGRGLLVVFEGFDGAGKTTLIKKIIERFGDKYDFKYCKAVGSDNFFGKLAKKFTKTFLFIAELLYITFFHIKPALKRNKIVLQDRYDISVIAHISEKDIFNQCLFKIFKPFFLKPDLLFYITVDDEERAKRLKSMPYSRFHQILINKPELVKARKKRYEQEFHNRDNKMIIVDTSIILTERMLDIISEIIMREINEVNAQ